MIQAQIGKFRYRTRQEQWTAFGFKLDGTDSSKTNEGDFLVLDTSDDENDRILFEDASHGITLSGVGWNTFQFDNDHS